MMSCIQAQDDDTSGLDDLLLCESLVAALQHPRSARASWLDEKNEELGHMTLSDEEDSAYWIDEDDEKLCLAFPAVLDLDGAFSRLEPYFSISNCKSVIF